MKDIKVKDIINICNGKLICGDENKICKNIKKDTRFIEKGYTYVGIKGDRFDGNELYEEAIEKGAEICIISGIQAKKHEGKTIIQVEDSIKTLQQLAEYKRSLYNIPVIAVTGSVGKTTTKDLIASIMSQKYKVLKTSGNMNNHIGLPMTILQLEDHGALVVEMGMSHFGDISVLTNIAHPTMCVIGNIGTSHIDNLGSKENILKAKLEILEGTKTDSPIAINNDDELLNNWAERNKTNHKIITYGITNKSDVMAKDIKAFDNKSIFTLEVNSREYEVEIPIGGRHFVYNALCAICVGLENDIEIEKIIKGIKNVELTKRRMEVIKGKSGATIINDSYNASYDSVKAALEYLYSVEAKRKVAILGDMLGVGEYEKALHEKVGEEVVKNKIDVLITVGKASKNIINKVMELQEANSIIIHECESNEEAIEIAKKELRQGDIVLVKASNAMHFDEIVKGIEK